MRITLKKALVTTVIVAIVTLVVHVGVHYEPSPRGRSKEDISKTIDNLMDIIDHQKNSIDHLMKHINTTTTSQTPSTSTTTTTVPSTTTEKLVTPPRSIQIQNAKYLLSQGHDNTVSRIWPVPGEREDRVLAQMALHEYSKSTKTILVYQGVKSSDTGNKKLVAHECPVTNCHLTGDIDEAATADAILFEGRITEPLRNLHRTRPKGQLWVLYFLESPFHTMGLKEYFGKVNFTATYRRDSTMVTPYERWVQFNNITSLPEKPSRNFAQGKTKKVAWFVSNCGDKNGRLAYAKELKKYIEVDIYGSCGDKKCPRGSARCTDMLRTDYKFYLAFENSNCKDYVTEKLYWNAYQNDVVPIVMGARPEDYLKVAPPGSYIHVDNFAGPEALANYLHLLDKDDTLYNQYFRWRDTGEFINTKWWCRLCAMVHQPSLYAHQEVMRDLEAWWRGPGVCISPKPQKQWASWRA